MPKQSWLDETTQMPQIDQYARKLGSFIDAMADGKVDEAEVAVQEERVARLMKEIERQLDAPMHAKMTELLCELTAYNLMQVFCSLNAARPKFKFHG